MKKRIKKKSLVESRNSAVLSDPPLGPDTYQLVNCLALINVLMNERFIYLFIYLVTACVSDSVLMSELMCSSVDAAMLTKLLNDRCTKFAVACCPVPCQSGFHHRAAAVSSKVAGV